MSDCKHARVGTNDTARALRMLAIVGGALILSMTTWFSATAILPDLQRAYGLTDAGASWLTNALQAGFVVAALGLSVSGLVDVIETRSLMVGAALLAACANAALLVAPNGACVFAARAVNGMALAAVYPPALKLLAGWFRAGRGLAMGAAVGALTLGSAGPYLVKALGGHLDWRAVVVAASAAALGAAALLLRVREGPYAGARPRFDLRRVAAVLRDPDISLANLGYFGHMWELYAMWGWLLAYATAAAHIASVQPAPPALLTFLVIAIGAAGCLAGGALADRLGRPFTAAAMMVVSGACAAGIGFAFDGPGWLFLSVALIWGFTVVADSAQFSALVTELSTPETVGAALALQTGVGFLLTIVSIRLVPVVAAHVGWRWTFLLLVPGPTVGAAAMLVLRRRLEGARRRNPAPKFKPNADRARS